MGITLEDAVEIILRNKECLNGGQGDNFHITTEDIFDDAPIGVDVSMRTNEDEEGYLSWRAVVYPLMEVTDVAEGTVVMPDFHNSLLGFHLLFTNHEKTKLEISMSFSE